MQLERGQRDLLDVIRAAGVEPGDVWLEVTERMDTGEDITGAGRARCAQAGVHFALDDFGMSLLEPGLPAAVPGRGPEDRQVVRRGDDQRRPPTRGIVPAILAMADSLSIERVRRGHRDAAQLDALLDLGCGFGQGHLISPPLSVERATEALRAQRGR